MLDYQWAVVGAGAAGIASIGNLLDLGVQPEKIVWIDPQFTVGDLGEHWSFVSSNTKVKTFIDFLNSCESFSEALEPEKQAIFKLDPETTCQLQYIVEPLQAISDLLQSKVHSIKDTVLSIETSDNKKILHTAHNSYTANKIILAIGSEPRQLVINNTNVIDIKTALSPEKLAKAVRPTDIIGVFGSSHTAIILLRELLALGVEKVINFYRSPIRFAEYKDGWILYDNTGLKGTTAEWAKIELDKISEEKLLRIESNDKTIRQYIPECTKVIYATGFKTRHIPINNSAENSYDHYSGVIAPGIFGCGIAFPEFVTDRAGNEEFNVGLWKFMKFLKRVVPEWAK